MNRWTFLVGLAALVPAAALIATAWPEAPPPPTPRPAPVAEPERAPKADALPRFVERWVPPPSPTIEPVAVAAVAVPGEAPAPPVRQRAPRDVCAAHGMHREYYKGRGGWQHWRCVR